MSNDFTKEFFQKTWGDGYYEEFSYGVGINRVCEVALNPFFNPEHDALEIGCGGGAFTKRMNKKFQSLTVVDVIQMPKLLETLDLCYVELFDPTYRLPFGKESRDFCFSYNVFCHMSNQFLKEYLKEIHRVLKQGGDFVFMLSNYLHTQKINPPGFSPGHGELLPMGHFCQNDLTIDIITDPRDWTVVKRNMIPEHRDIIVHLKRKA